MAQDLETRRRRAAYRAAHRGTKEMDFLLGRYAAARLPDMDDAAMTRFEELLAIADPELQSWILNGEIDTRTAIADLLYDIRAFHGLDSAGAEPAP